MFFFIFRLEKRKISSVDHLQHAYETVYRCHHCPYQTTKKIELTLHTAISHADEVFTYTCDYCTFETNQLTKFHSHLSRIHKKNAGSDENFQCRYCHSECPLSKYKYYNHLIYKCEQCDFQTSREICLTQHVNKVHKQHKQLNCSLCHYQTRSESLLSLHTGVHRIERKTHIYKCPKCIYSSKYKGSLFKHTLERHKGLMQDASGTAMQDNKEDKACHMCSHCDFQAEHKGSLYKHFLDCHEVLMRRKMRYHCHHCKYKSKTKQLLQKHHMMMHTKKRAKKEDAVEDS